MSVLSGYGSSLIVTKGYGRKYLSPFAKVRDFEKSFYKFVGDNYSSHSIYFGSENINIGSDDIWLRCYFKELNVETGNFSIVFIDAVTRIQSVDEYNIQLVAIMDELMDLFANPDISLYDFTYPEYPQEILDTKIVIQDDGGKQIFESLNEVELEDNKALIQLARMVVEVKLLDNFATGRSI